MAKRNRRTRATGRSSGFGDFERYALIPSEVIESKAYQALPDYAARVLVALAGQCRKSNNGLMSLQVQLAHQSGIPRWKLYAGLDLLQRTGLVIKTRQGGMRPYGPTLYAVTWWPIVESKKYDSDIHWGLDPRNTWASWSRPIDWPNQVKEVEGRARGRGSRMRARARMRIGNGSPGSTVRRIDGPPV